MYEYANIKAYKAGREGTHLQIFIPEINLTEPILKKQIKDCMVWLDDGRHISAKQRKKAYATINDMAAFTGYLPEEMKEWLKYEHIVRTGGKYFSLSDCTMDTARAFINTMLDLALEMGVPLRDFGRNRTDDISHYLWACLKHKKCAVCGRDGEIHHVDAIGMGGDRREVDDSKHRKICLCRIHHTEAHTMGMGSFEEKYFVYGIEFVEENHMQACKIWNESDCGKKVCCFECGDNEDCNDFFGECAGMTAETYQRCPNKLIEGECDDKCG